MANDRLHNARKTVSTGLAALMGITFGSAAHATSLTVQAAAIANPCSQPSLIDDLKARFNATSAATAYGVAIVAVSRMTTMSAANGTLVCHGTVLDNTGAGTPMRITMSKDVRGHSNWALRLDE